MAGNTDKRVIQMQFENKQFEKNIAKSTKSVEELKQSMDFEEVSKGLKKFAEGTKNLTIAGFDKLTDNIQKLTDKFTGLGTLSELVISQIRRGIESAAREISNFVSSMTTAQVSAGMDKYNTLNKSVQTIKAATGESEETVYGVLKRLSEYTDQTSYNFADMAQNIGKFTSVGIGLEDAERQMEGIANWAARSGAGINEASRAMYNLSQAMGVGKLTKIDWKSIENAGMATKEFKEQLIQAGVAAGTLVEKQGKYFTKQGNTEVSFKNVADTLAKGWATNEVVSATLEKYYYDDLYYARDEALKEFLDSDSKIDASEWLKIKDNNDINIKEFKKSALEALATLGKLTKETSKDGKIIYKTTQEIGEVVEVTMDNFDEKIVGKGLLDKEVVDGMDSLAKTSFEAAQKCLTFTDVLGAWRDQISSGWMQSFTIIFGELSEAMQFFSDVCNRVGDGLGEIIEFRNNILEFWKGAGGRQSLIDLIVGNYGDNVSEGAYGFLDLLEGAGSIIKDGLKNFLMLFMGAGQKKMMDEDPEYLQKWIAGLLLHITNSIRDFMKNIRNFFTESIEVNGKTTTRLEIVQNVVNGIAGALKIGYDILTKAIEFISEIGSDLSPGFNALLGFFGDLGKSIYDTADQMGQENRIKMFFDGIREDVKPVVDALNDLMMSISDLLRALFGLDKEGATQTENVHAIGDAIRTVARIISKVLGPVIKFVSRFVDAIGKLFKNGVNADSLKEFGSDLGNAFGDMMKTFADSLPDSLGFVKDWVNKLFGGGEEAVQEKSNSLFSLIKGEKKEADKITKDAQKSESKGPGILGLMTGSNIAVWLGVASLASVVLLLRKARKVVGSIGGFFGSLGDTLKNGISIKYKDETFATKFLKIAGAIALIAAAVIALGSIPLQNLLQGVAAVVVIMGAMFVLFKLLQKSFAKGNDLKSSLAFAGQMTAMAASFAMLAVAIGMIALALIPFTLMSWEQYAKAMAGLGGILLQLAAFMGIIKLMKVGNVKLAGFAGFAIGIGLIVQGIQPFANMSWEQYAKAMAGLGGVLIQLLAFMGLMRLMDIGVKGIKLAGIVAFAIAIVLLVQAIKPFANMSWDQYAKVMAGLGGVLLELIAFMGLLRLLDIGTKGIKLSGIVSFALAIVVLIQAILPFKDMTWDQYAKVMAGLGGVLLELVAFMGLMRLLDIGTKGIKLSGIISFALAIVILIQAIMPFKDLTWEQYAKVMAGLGGVLLELVAFMGLMRLMDIGVKGIKLSGFILFVIGLKLLIDSIMPFTTMSWDQYGRAMAGLGGMLLELIAFMGLMKLIGSKSLDIAAFMPFAYGIQALVNAIIPFASMSWEDYSKTMAGLAGVLAIMLGFMAVLKLVKPSIKNMLQMAIFAGIFAAVAGVFGVVLGLVKDMDWKVIAAFSAGLAVLMVAFAAAAAIATVVGIKGFLILAAGMAILMAVIALLAPMLIGSVMTAIRDASSSLVLISDMISKFSDNMSGVDEGDTDKAGRIFDKVIDIVKKLAGMVFEAGNTYAFMYAMSSLTLAADEIIKFDNRMKQVSADGGSTKALGIITMYRGLFENDLVGFDAYIERTGAFYDVMFKLGSAFDYFDSVTKDVANAEDNQGFQLIKQLAACAPDLDTIYKMDLGKFKNQLAELGGAMIVYAKGAEEVNGGEINDSTDVSGAVTLLHKISESLTENGGFSIPDNMPKEDQLTEFGTQLAALAGALVAFEEAGSKLGAGKDTALETLTFFKDLKEQLALMPGFGSDINSAIGAFKDEAGNFIQKDELTVFAEDIAQLGSAMAHFAASTQVIDEETKEAKPIDFSLATTALDSIASLSEKLPSFGGIKEMIIGRKESLGELATEINLLGDAIGEFYKSTNTFDEVNKTATPFDFGTENTGVIGFLNSIADIQNKLPTVRSFSLQSLFENEKMSFGELSSQLILLGSGLEEMSKSITGIDPETGNKKFDLDSADDAIKFLDEKIIPLMNTLQQKLPDVGGIGNIIKTIVNGRDFDLTDLGKQLGPLGEGLGTLGQNLNTGNWTSNEGVINAFNSMDSILNLMMKIQEFFKRMEELGLDSNTAGETAFAGLSEFLDHMSDDTNRVIEKLSLFMTRVNDGLSEWAEDKLDNILKRMEAFKYFSEGLNSLIGSVTFTNGYSADWKVIGNKLTTEIATAITDGTKSVTDAVISLFNQAYAAGNPTSDSRWKSLGENVVLGVELGIKTAAPNHVTPAVRQMMVEAYNEGKKAIDSNSPSKLFMELGSFMGEGTAIGIKKSTGEVGENAAEMGEVALDSARDMIGLISRIMAEGTDATPTIAPILDMTNIDAGMAAFRESLNGYGINLDTAFSAGRAAQIGTSSYVDPEALKPDYTGIYQKMEELGVQMQQMGREIRNIKLVLDTGAVAGGVADILDEEFGRRTFYELRG